METIILTVICPKEDFNSLQIVIFSLFGIILLGYFLIEYKEKIRNYSKQKKLAKKES